MSANGSRKAGPQDQRAGKQEPKHPLLLSSVTHRRLESYLIRFFIRSSDNSLIQFRAANQPAASSSPRPSRSPWPRSLSPDVVDYPLEE